jgi:large subunit ribosomal protein L21
MYAVILTGGKQYRVTAGDTIQVEKLAGNPGDSIKIEQIMALSGDKTLIGTPHVSGALVEATIVAQGKGDKVLIFKKKRRHNYRRLNGHRQHLTTLYITNVALGGNSLAKSDYKAPVAKKADAPAAEAKQAKKPAAKAAKPAAKKEAAPKKPAAKKSAAKKEA